MRNETRRIALLGVLTSVALVLSYLEVMLPPISTAVPGIKMGLPNIIIIFVLYKFGLKEAVTVSLIRVFVVALIFGGNIMTLAYSVAGAVLSLALMTLFTYEKDLLPLSGMIDYYGLTDFTTFYDEGYSKYDETDFTNIYDLLGEYKEDNLELYKEASPIYHIHENMKLPPILILHGSKDHVVPFEQSVKLYYKLMENHYNATLCKVNHADHGRSIFYVKEVYDYIINFLNRYKKDSFDKSFFDQRLKQEEVNIEECIKLLLEFHVSEKTIVEGLYNQFCIDEKNALIYVEKVKLRRYLDNPLNTYDYYTNEDIVFCFNQNL